MALRGPAACPGLREGTAPAAQPSQQGREQGTEGEGKRSCAVPPGPAGSEPLARAASTSALSPTPGPCPTASTSQGEFKDCPRAAPALASCCAGASTRSLCLGNTAWIRPIPNSLQEAVTKTAASGAQGLSHGPFSTPGKGTAPSSRAPVRPGAPALSLCPLEKEQGEKKQVLLPEEMSFCYIQQEKPAMLLEETSSGLLQEAAASLQVCI